VKLSTKGRYSARAMLELALNYDKGPLILGEIAKRQEISVKYLERIMNLLVAAGLVRSERGKNGGFRITKDPSKIKLGQIIRITEGSLSIVNCVDDEKTCRRSKECIMRLIWTKVASAMDEVLYSITLQDMVDMHKAKQSGKGPGMYHI